MIIGDRGVGYYRAAVIWDAIRTSCEKQPLSP